MLPPALLRHPQAPVWRRKKHVQFICVVISSPLFVLHKVLVLKETHWLYFAYFTTAWFSILTYVLLSSSTGIQRSSTKYSWKHPEQPQKSPWKPKRQGKSKKNHIPACSWWKTKPNDLPECAAAWTWWLPLRCTGHQGSSRNPGWSLLNTPLEICTSDTKALNRFNAEFLPGHQRKCELYLQKAWQQQEQRGQQSQAGRCAQFVRVVSEAGGEPREPKRSLVGQEAAASEATMHRAARHFCFLSKITKLKITRSSSFKWREDSKDCARGRGLDTWDTPVQSQQQYQQAHIYLFF